MKSRTRPTSKSSANKKEKGARPKVVREKVPRAAAGSAAEVTSPSEPLVAETGAEGFPELLAVGHEPGATLTPQDETLFRAFQSNLLSLISHELRTPLMGVLNALSLLEDVSASPSEAGSPISMRELAVMARQNADRLHRSLTSLLDLAALESGTFHARLRETDLHRLVRARMEAQRSALKDQGLEIRELPDGAGPVLADPQRLGRAVELCFQILIPRARTGSELGVSIVTGEDQGAPVVWLELSAELTPEASETWARLWSQAVAGFEGGVASPLSAFGGVLQSEQAFLTRTEEGLGSEFLLVHEILRLHHGVFHERRSGSRVTLQLQLPELASEAGLRAVLLSRASAVATDLGSVALILLEVPERVELSEFRNEVQKSLFRATDAAYSLPEQGRVALVLDDCRPEDAPRLIGRIEERMRSRLGSTPAAGFAHCPSDASDPGVLLELASQRLKADRAEKQGSTP